MEPETRPEETSETAEQMDKDFREAVIEMTGEKLLAKYSTELEVQDEMAKYPGLMPRLMREQAAKIIKKIKKSMRKGKAGRINL